MAVDNRSANHRRDSVGSVGRPTRKRKEAQRRGSDAAMKTSPTQHASSGRLGPLVSLIEKKCNKCVNCGKHLRRFWRKKYCDDCRISLEIMRREINQANAPDQRTRRE